MNNQEKIKSANRSPDNLAVRIQEQDRLIADGLKQLNGLIDMGYIKRPTYRLSMTGKAPVKNVVASR